ncbi:MAG: DUF1343 domain-containing protein [Bacteroidales bacterium]
MRKNSMLRCFVFFMLILMVQGCRGQAGDSPGDAGTVPGKPLIPLLQTGAERTDLYFPLLKGKKIGVTGNQTSLIGSVHLVDSLLRTGIEVIKVFCPEHGFRGEAEAGKTIQGGKDDLTGLPVVSLYGKKKKPSAEDLEGIGIMVFDIQDVGARFYTYISTLHYVMEACAEKNIPLLVLDRPNPNGHYVDGPVLKPGFTSFIGMHHVALVHGMTMAEYARMINDEGWLAGGVKCDLSWVPVSGYAHSTTYQLPVAPSPNLQDMDAVYLYPSVCLLEGTIASVGRGTDFPFRLVGHPSVKTGDTTFIPRSIPGKSESPKLLGQTCHGWRLDGANPDGSSMLNSLDLTWLLRLYKETGGGEGFFTSSFDLLAGTDLLRKQILEGKSEAEITISWQNGLNEFKTIRKKYLLYPE